MNCLRMGLAALLALAGLWGNTATAQTLSDAEQGFRIMANRQQGNCVTCHPVSVLRDAKGIDGAAGNIRANQFKMIRVLWEKPSGQSHPFAINSFPDELNPCRQH